MSEPRFPQQRQDYVLEQLAAHGRVEAARLAHELDVSTESIRKDLGALEDRGLLRRVHGGAIPVRELTVEVAVQARTGNAAEKAAIARAALAHVPDGGTVLIDAGSTTARLAALLPGEAGLGACTNALPIATVLAAKPGVSVRFLGGAVRRPTLAAVGQDTVDQLASINVDVAFLGTNGISAERGLTTPDEAEAAVKSAMLGAARRRILLADHTKFGRVSLCRHARLGDIDLLVTDASAPAADLARVRDAGVQVQVVDVP